MSCNDCNPCSPCEEVSASNETLPSIMENFILHFFGTVTKTVVDGKVVWTLPCDLAEGIANNPREDGEGLACYFRRLFENGIVGLTGAQGDQGDTGADGKNGFTTVAADFETPDPDVCPTIQIEVSDGSVIPEGTYVFIETAGWFEVTAVTGNVIAIKCKQLLSSAADTVVAGMLVTVTGPVGPQGAKGAKGDKGDKGDTGSTGSAGANGTDGEAAKTVTNADYVQPAAGSTVVISVDDSSAFVVGAQCFVVNGGYYEVAAVGAGTITARNLSEIAPNVSSGSTVTSGKATYVAGFGPIAPSVANNGSGSSYALTDTYAAVDFGTDDLDLDLPMAGTYQLVFNVQVKAGNPFATGVSLKLYNDTDAAAITGTEREATLSANDQDFPICLTTIVSVASAKTIKLYGKRDAGATSASIISTKSNSYFVRVNRI
jgi:hypothetical protein